MNRVEFMDRLEKLLQDIPVEEREEALQYYCDYFADAGIEKEADIIKELESPEKVAQTIKADLLGEENVGGYDQEGLALITSEEKQQQCQGKKRGWMILLLILALPVLLPLGAAILGLSLAILMTAVVIVGTILFSGIIIAGGGIFCLICTAMMLSSPVALAFLGSGCLMLALGAAMTVVVWWGVLKIVPPMFRRLVECCRRKLHRTK